MTYENQHVLRQGGITLYTRNGSPIYHCRLRIPGHPRYIIRTTKCTSLDEAIEFAEDLFLELRTKAKNGLEVEAHTFASMWKRWLKDHKDHVSVHRLRYLEGTANRYFLPYFGSASLESLSQAKVSGYWSWRRNYWNSADGMAKIEAAQKTRTTKKRPYKQKLGNVAKVPSFKTLQMEQAALRQLFRWAIDNFGKTFKKVLTEAGLLRDREGNVRTIYSLRHRFITSRLLDGGAQIEDLAQNTGTSVRRSGCSSHGFGQWCWFFRIQRSSGFLLFQKV